MANSNRLCIFFVFLIGSNFVSPFPFNICPTVNMTCNSKLAVNSECVILPPVLSSECGSWTFDTNNAPSRNLGSVKLEAYTTEYLPASDFSTVHRMYTGINLTLSDINWSYMRIRYKQMKNKWNFFCREFRMFKKENSSNPFYDCWWIFDMYEGTNFTVEYEAYGQPWIERRKYIFQIPHPVNIANDIGIEDWIPFIYVDVSEMPTLTTRWQRAPSHMSVRSYRIRVFKDRASVESSIWRGPFEEETEQLYIYDTNNVTGIYHFEVTVEGDYKFCNVGLCRTARSPDIIVGDPSGHSKLSGAASFINAKTLTIGIGCVVLIPLLVFFIHIWTRRRKPPTGRIKLPIVLVVYTPSRSSHVEAVVALVEYLRNYCAVEALLDRLDIVETVSKDPFMWCNKAYARADFVMIFSSPPKCCSQQDIFRNVDVDSLQLVKRKFLDHSSRPYFFTVLLPYCTVEDIPEEARHFRRFTLTKDLDKMLWYIHNNGKLPNPLVSLWITIGPKLNGGKSDLKTKGLNMLKAMELAENDLSKSCSCAKLEINHNIGDDESNNADTNNTLPNNATSQESSNTNDVV